MKKIILSIAVFIFSYANAQEREVPLNAKIDDSIGIVYYKDLDDELIPYVGTWEGKIDGNTFRITFERRKVYVSNKSYRDLLWAQYEMKDAQGKILYTTYNQPIERSKFMGLGFRKNKTLLRCSFLDACIDGQIDLKFVDDTKKQVEWSYEAMPVLVTIIVGKKYPNCAKINEMPQKKFILTKQ